MIHSTRRRTTAWLFHAAIATAPIAGCAPGAGDAAAPAVNAERAEVIAVELDSILNQQYDIWYPRTIDNEYGGFLSRFDYKWDPVGDQAKMIVTQARHTWSTGLMAQVEPDRRDEFLEISRHGFEFLRDKMWDREFGGFYTDATREGAPVPNRQGELNKGLYGNAFAIYGLARYYEASNDQEALDLAIRTFRWLDQGAHDKENGFYFNTLDRQGRPLNVDSPRTKDYNSGIHILEALAELYRVWPDTVLRDRLEEAFRVVRDDMIDDRGFLRLNFSRDLTPLSFQDSSRAVQERNLGSDHITFGHDIETAYLLIEAAHTLGLPDDSVMSVAKRLVDHTLDNSWDEENGGIYDLGYYFTGTDSVTVTSEEKVWWSQVEAFHTLILMAQRFPDDPRDYFGHFDRQWEYIKQYMLDPVHGEWYPSGLDHDPDAAQRDKATIWKGNYHGFRGFIGAREMLREGAGH